MLKQSSTKDVLKAAKILKNGGVGVIPTDTIYGIVGIATSVKTVERIYRIRKRSPQKPFIILISSLKNLGQFNIKLTTGHKELLKKIWPNPISVVLECNDKNLEYLHRGTKTLAFRIPDDEKLQKLLAITGPIVAPSANLEGQKNAKKIDEAVAYFSDQVDFYLDAGPLLSPPSTLVKLKNDQLEIIREGSIKAAFFNTRKKLYQT